MTQQVFKGYTNVYYNYTVCISNFYKEFYLGLYNRQHSQVD
jgi:hypothetical protein